jgi:hypothetical protein
MINFQIEYELNGGQKMLRIKASSIGVAFAKCFERFPGCKLIKGHVSSYTPGIGRMSLSYDPPSTLRITSLPAEKFEQAEFDLHDERMPKSTFRHRLRTRAAKGDTR